MPSELYARGRRKGMAAASDSQKLIKKAGSIKNAADIAAKVLREILAEPHPAWYQEWPQWKMGFLDGFMDRSEEWVE